MEPELGRLKLARLALACLDLTSLKADDTDASVEALAALCVYPPFVPVAKRALAQLSRRSQVGHQER